MHIIVPYRDRPEHLEVFTDHMAAYLPGIPISVIEQADSKPFNRAKLLNIGVLECIDTHYVMHDVDLLPVKVDYTPTDGVTQLAGSHIQQSGYLGGVTMWDSKTLSLVDGYNNEYFHRAEDNEVMFQLFAHKIDWVERIGEFRPQYHPRTSPEFIPWLWQKAQLPRKKEDGLSNCKYELVSRDQKYNHTLIKVRL